MTDHSRKAVLGAATAALALAAAAPARGQAALPKLRIGSGPADAYAEGWYGVDMGFFKNAGLDVDYYPFNSGSLATAAVLSGACDIVCGATLTLAIAVSKNVPLGIVAPAAVNTAKGPKRCCAFAETVRSAPPRTWSEKRSASTSWARRSTSRSRLGL